MFSVCENKGFTITFENGNTVSVQFGPGNYCDPCHKAGRNAPYNAPSQAQVWKSTTAEIAAWDSNNRWHRFDHDTVDGWQGPDAVAKFIEFVSSNELNTGRSWERTSEDDYDEDDYDGDWDDLSKDCE